MKNALIVFTLVLGSASAFACELPEALFTGKVKAYNQADCSYQIEFTEYNESGVCGLHKDEVDYATFVDASCSLKNGDEISGAVGITESGILSLY